MSHTHTAQLSQWRSASGVPGSRFYARSDKVNFCGYSVPHPSEPKMNLRLQTKGSRACVAVAGLD